MMKIAYLTHYDTRDINCWSGTGYYIGQELRRQQFTVENIGPLGAQGVKLIRLKQLFYANIARKAFIGEVNKRLLKGYAAQATAKISATGADVVLALHPCGVAYLEHKQPVVLWVDCTFAGMVDFYPDYIDLCGESLRDGHRMEALALERCELGIFASDWAARSAVEHYGFDEKKVAVVPFGANIVCNRTTADIEDFIHCRPANHCQLLFMGKIWERKGGSLAMEVAKRLNEAGLPTTLTLVGSRPPGDDPLPDYVRPMGFINKATEAGRKQIDSLIGSSHFLIVPSRAEAYGIVFCEASSFGVPSLTTNVGGIPTVVREGKNGCTFGLAAPPEEYTRYILKLMGNRRAYEELSRSSFNEYQTRLNWAAAGASVKKLLERF